VVKKKELILFQCTPMATPVRRAAPMERVDVVSIALVPCSCALFEDRRG
jgi:hypothetical protein